MADKSGIKNSISVIELRYTFQTNYKGYLLLFHFDSLKNFSEIRTLLTPTI